jgi:hypothetical protein
MGKRKKITAFFSLGALVFSLLVFYFLPSFRLLASADDDEEEQEEEREEDSNSDRNSTDSTSSSKTSVETNVTTSTKTILLPDSDGDGILDKNDPHPAVAEIYVVEDNNFNGLVDKFEKDVR